MEQDKSDPDAVEQAQAGQGADADRDGVIPQDERMGTLIFAGVLTALGIFWVYAASDLPSRQTTTYLSQGFLPIVAGILLAVLSALLMLSTWLTKSRPAEELGTEPLFERHAQIRGAAVFGVLLLYIIALPHIHYAITTFFLMASGLALAREPIRPRLFILAAVLTAFFFSVFVWGLQIALPGSIFG